MKLWMVLISWTALLITGCAEHSMRVFPEIINQQQNAPIRCKLDYDGNREYIPKSIVETNDSNLSAQYSYQIKYVNGNTDWDGLNLFNPLILVGFHLSEESVIVEGKLELNNGSDIQKVLTSTCIATKTRSLYQTGGSSGPRKDCLLAVRDNIDMQLINLLQGVKK